MSNLPQRLSKCPKTPECAAKAVFQDEDGNLFRFAVKVQAFVPHVCSSSANSSTKPVITYLAEWYNTDSKRTRWVGPDRMRRTVEKAPPDGRYRKRGSDNNPLWKLKKTYVAELDWKPVKD